MFIGFSTTNMAKKKNGDMHKMPNGHLMSDKEMKKRKEMRKKAEKAMKSIY